MANRKNVALFRKNDLAGWNFAIFLTLAFVLLVLVVAATKNMVLDLRSRAGLTCPSVTDANGQFLDSAGNPIRVESCKGGKLVVSRGANGCLKAVCEATK